MPLIFPIWTVQFPPLLDYPNHLASSYVLAHLHDPSLPFQRWYGAEWGFYPYLIFNASVYALQWLFPVELAGRLFLTAAVIGLPLATWFFLRQANPGEDSMALWSLVGAHNIFFLLSYVSFYASLTFVFLGLGLWLKWLRQPRGTGWALAMLAFTALYLSHLISFGVAGLVVTAYLLLARRNFRQALLSWAMFLPGACFYLGSARVVERQSGGLVFLGFAEKLDNLKAFMHGYSERLDTITLLGLAIYFVAATIRNPESHWNKRWLGIGVALFAAYWVMPWAYGDGSDLDVRILPILFGVVLAFVRVGRRGLWLAPFVLALFLARVANITENYRGMQPELEGLAGSFAVTPPDARVLPIVRADPDSDVLHHAFAHFWSYGVIRRHWFSPYLFEVHGLLPLRVRQPSYTLDGFWDLEYKETPDWAAIQADYDYVWSYNLPQFDANLAKIATLVYSSGKLKMYRVIPSRASP